MDRALSTLALTTDVNIGVSKGVNILAKLGLDMVCLIISVKSIELPSVVVNNIGGGSASDVWVYRVVSTCLEISGEVTAQKRLASGVIFSEFCSMLSAIIVYVL